MFPQNGENIPEIRFKGFTNAWEQCELGNAEHFIMGVVALNSLLQKMQKFHV